VVWLFRTFKGPGAYRIDVGGTVGEYLRGSTDEEIIGTVQACHDRVKAARGDDQRAP
jgi:hypothetical protein